MANNKSLQRAQNNKNDEFYTQLHDIAKEVSHYTDDFKDKTVICNCDDPRISNFVVYFALNFASFGLKRLIATCYKNQNPDLFSQYQSETAVYLDYDGSIPCNSVEDIRKLPVYPLKGDGDFRSKECLELLDQADIVCTNPPFSLVKEFIPLIVKHNKKFLVIGNQNELTYKEIFPLIKNNVIWTGYNFGDMSYMVPDYYPPMPTRYWVDENGRKWRSMGNTLWFTNLDVKKRHEEYPLWKKYTPETYGKCDVYDAIWVTTVKDIPCDYYEDMAVPITFIDKYNPNQFEIVGVLNHGSDHQWDFAKAIYQGKEKFKRFIIRRKQ